MSGVENHSSRLTRLVITCGGTGGHFYPGLSIAVAARQRNIDVRLLLSGVNSVAQSRAAEAVGIRAEVLPDMPPPGSPIKAWRFVRGAFGGWRGALRSLKNFRPQAVLGMGSFAMTPVLFAAKMRGIPLFLHDGNTVIGKANRFFSRLSRAVGCAYPPVNPQGIHAPWQLVGMPVRQVLRDRASIGKAEAIAELNRNYDAALEPDVTTVLVIGGSQGAAKFNTTLPEAFKTIASPLQVLHLAGKGKIEDARRAYRGFAGRVLLLESSERMEWFLGAADLVFARAGGSTLAELTLFGKPAVLIPYPFAAEQHQRRNAEWFVSIGGGRLIDNAELSAETAADMLRLPAGVWSACAAVSRSAARPDAAEKMLEMIENHIQ